MSQLLSPLPAQGSLVTLGDLTLKGSSFDRTKPLLLLCYLCLEGPKERRHLAELFWPGAADPLASLATELSRLKRHLGDVVDTDASHTKALLQTDVQVFLRSLERQDLSQAAAVYKGDFLKGVALKNVSQELEAWVYGTREFLAGRARDVLLGLGEAAARRDDYTEAAGRAHEAYAQVQTAALEPEQLRRAYTLLVADDHPWAATLREEARDLGMSLDVSKVEARKRLRPAQGDALPGDATSFVGRGAEVRDVVALLRGEARLVSVVGLAGTGKSRLAAEVVRNLQAEGVFPDGVHPVWLVALTRPDDVPTAFANALGLVEEKEGPLEGVARHIEDRRTLVYFDNYEHVIEGASFLSELLTRCPKLKILVTSRERLNLEEEWTFWLEGLSVAAEPHLLSDAAELFIARAKRMDVTFAVPENLEAIDDLCALVEGSPLALELAASWVRVMSCAEVKAQFEQDLGALSTRLKNTPERHRSLEVAFGYSWDLLSGEERRVLRELSVFRGGFSLEGARRVAGAGLSTLVSLTDKSLLKQAGGRYGRHPLLYNFTQHKLAEHPEVEAAARHRHAAFYTAWAEEAAPHLSGGEQATWLERVARDLSNVQVAARWAVAHGEVELGLRVLTALETFWYVRDVRAGKILLEETLASAELDPTNACRADASRVLGVLRWRENDLGGAGAAYEDSLAAYRANGDEQGVAKLLNNLGILASLRGEFGEAQGLYEESLTIKRRLGDKRGVAASLNNLGIAARHRGDNVAAYAFYRESLALEQELNNAHGLIASLNNLGKVSLTLGREGQAHKHLAEALRLERELSDMMYLLDTLNVLAAVEATADRFEHAATLLSAEKALRGHFGVGFRPEERAEFEKDVSLARTKLSEVDFGAGWTKGCEMDKNSAIAYALEICR